MKRATLLLAVLFVVPFTLPLHAQTAEGDRQWAARATGAQNGRAQAAPIDAAIAAYQRAIAQNPHDIEAHWKLLRAYRFKGAYVAQTNEQKKAIYSLAKKAGEQALAQLKISSKLSEKQAAEAARAIPGAAEVYLWDAVNWGEWALAYGKMAAAREGAADRIRREATIAHLVNPRLEEGAPARVLGRLHDQTPRIPFLTGWASEKEAVKFLNESLKMDPANKITMVFLAEAMVSNDSSTKAAAIQMLRNAVNAPNDGPFVVEQTAAANDAKALLKKWGA
ncbi:MAG TPA: hypothetical protein VFN10_03395 [Thermoanaerobaculia bacterium]|nr:hypothetical protein [Thermoanaerobaculia bacterium]